MSNNKELPKEVMDEIHRQESHNGLLNSEECIRIAQSHYEPIITEKDAKIDKLTALLKNEHTYQVAGALLAANTSIESVELITNRIWEKFKEKHGL